MEFKKWIFLYFLTIVLFLGFVVLINIFVNPYGLFDIDFIKNRPIIQDKTRFIKPLEVSKIKPASIVLGTSRAEYYNPDHAFFDKPSYNFALSGGSIYEANQNLKWAAKQNKLKRIFLGLDYRAFVGYRKSKLSDFDSVFNKVNLYSHLFGLDTLKDSIVSLVDKKNTIVYKKGYAIKNTHKQREFDLGLDHLSITINTEKTYYKNQKFSYNYLDDKTNSIDDFTEILKICYKNDIELVIVINPSHIRLWESLDYHVGYNTWLKWKKDVVLQNDKVSKEFGKNPFEIYDFAIYNKFTSEKFLADKNATMQYYWEASHFKKEFGNIVLDEIVGMSHHEKMYVKLTSNNIDEHLQNLKKDRAKFIDTKSYRKEVFGIE